MGAIALHRARFAKRHELRELLSTTPLPESVLLGMRQDLLVFKRLVAVRPTSRRREIGNTLIVGPTRSGKGLLATSQLLTWQHSVIVNDIKGELFSQTAGYRSTLGEVYVLDPNGVGHAYDPLQEKKSEDALLSAASHLLYQADETDGRIFTQRATVMPRNCLPLPSWKEKRHFPMFEAFFALASLLLQDDYMPFRLNWQRAFWMYPTTKRTSQIDFYSRPGEP